MEAHDTATLAQWLDALADAVPRGAIYRGCSTLDDGCCLITLVRSLEDTEPVRIAIGRAEQVGPAWRLTVLPTP